MSIFKHLKKKYIKYIFNKNHNYLKTMKGGVWISVMIFGEHCIIKNGQYFEDFYKIYFK